MSADPWDEAVTKARQAIYDDGRGMIGRNAGYLQDRVARAILAERKEASDALASKEEEIRGLKEQLAARSQPSADAEEALAPKPHADGWRDIESAPPYGVQVLLIGKYPTGYGWSDIYHGWRNAGGSNWDRWPHNFRPTHWMPLPAPPTHGEEK